METLKKIATLSLVLMVVLFTACDMAQNDQAQPASGTGKVVLKLTDAPFPAGDVERAEITVDTVWLRIAGGECKGINDEVIGDDDGENGTAGTVGTGTGGKDNGNGKGKGKAKGKAKGFDYSSFDCESGFVKFVYSEETLLKFDLMQLQNGVTLDLEGTIPVGSYDMIRLHIVKATITLKEVNKDGEDTFDLKIPSGSGSGLKLILDPILTVDEENVSEVVVDFDLSRSFIAQGNPKNKHGITGFIFKPVVRAANNKHAGALFGMVYENENTPVKGAAVTILHADTVVTSALSNPMGFYKVIGLPAGTYAIKVEADGYSPKTVEGIVIREKEKVKQDVKLEKLPL